MWMETHTVHISTCTKSQTLSKDVVSFARGCCTNASIISPIGPRNKLQIVSPFLGQYCRYFHCVAICLQVRENWRPLGHGAGPVPQTMGRNVHSLPGRVFLTKAKGVPIPDIWTFFPKCPERFCSRSVASSTEAGAGMALRKVLQAATAAPRLKH